MAEHDRLRWRCRRGHLELDLLLLSFLEQDYPRLTEAEQARFRDLLQLDDDTLLDMLSGQAVAEPWRGIIERLRQC